ncbi:MAG: MetQ/NlpA family ABC transporter substrate-binding protein [Deltaproteobacteria bacterium]|jgi:D-methionine transport system substrate-binding protein|nr:MetQ/NlpA family ABC transporter substrate-binding protein [Deltaproteobacteria bacterium]
MKKTLAFLTLFSLFFAAPAAFAQDSVVIGTVSGSDVAFLEKAAEIAAKDGLKVTIKEFSDYGQLNPALAAGDIDLNSFQHAPYLKSFLEDFPADLTPIGNTYVAPMGFYSKRIKNLDELKTGDVVVVQNDPSNGGRALLLLQKAGKIKLNPAAGITPTPYDITENPLKLRLIEVDAAQTPTALDDAVAVAVNNNYATPAGLNPLRDSIYLEGEDSPYINIIVARTKDKDNPNYAKFVKAYQSQEVAEFILEKDGGSTLPAFPYKKPE